MEEKRFKTTAAASLTTGRLLCDFGDMQELAEWLIGHPIWTHEFADSQLYKRLRDTAIAQCPQLAEIDAAGIDKTNWQEKVDELTERLGAELRFVKGSCSREQSPLETLNDIHTQAAR